MTNGYVKELISRLEFIEVWRKDEAECVGYDQGIDLLVGMFTRHKENRYMRRDIMRSWSRIRAAWREG